MNSRKGLAESYYKFAEEIQVAISNMREFMQSEYALKRNINILLCFSIDFAEKAKSILEETAHEIENHTVDENLCKRLEVLVGECAKEHSNINDTYDRLDHENTNGFYEFHKVLMAFRDICDSLSYLDETIGDLRNMINQQKTVASTVNISGGVENSQIQIGTTSSSQSNITKGSFKYEYVLRILDEIKKTCDDETIFKVFGEKASDFQNILNDAVKLATEKAEPSIMKKILLSLKDIANGVVENLIAAGIVGLINQIPFV